MKDKSVLILKVTIGIGILWYVFRITPVSEILAALSQTYLPLVIIGLLFDPVSLFLSALNMKVLFGIQGTKLPLRSILRINFITEFYGFFLPGLISSGLIRWHQFARASGKPADAFTSILFVRLWDTIITLAIGMIFWLFEPLAHSNKTVGALLVLSCCFICMIAVAIFNRRLSAFVRQKIVNRGFIPDSVKNKILALIDSSTRFGSSRKQVAGITLLIVTIRQILGLLTFVFFASSLGIHANLISLGWTYSMLNIVLILPITFSGIGVREGSLILLLNSYGVASAQAVALSWLLFLNVFVLRVIGGLLEAGRLFFRKYQARGVCSNTAG